MPNKQSLTKEKKGEMVRDEVDRILKTMSEKGISFKEAAGIKDEFIEEMYSIAYQNYEQAKYKEAIPLFQILIGISPDDFRFVYGLASCQHQTGEYQEASMGFGIALALQPTNPHPAYYIGECYLYLELFAEAKEYFQLSEMLCGDIEKYSHLKERCRLIYKSLEKKKREAFKNLTPSNKKKKKD